LDSQDHHLASAIRKPSSQFLNCANNANLNAGAAFSVEFWRNDFTRGADRHYINRWNEVNGQRSWSISSGDTINGANDATKAIRFWTSGDGTATTTRMTNQAVPNIDWSHCIAVFDGGQATDALKCRIYLDGVEMTTTGDTSLPASVFDNSKGLNIGRMESFVPTSYIDAAMNRVRYWPGRALTLAEVTTLHNSGRGLYHAGLSAALLTSLMASYDLPHQLTDLSGNTNTLTASGGPINPARIVTRFFDHGIDKLLFASPFTTGFHWEPYALNDRPGWVSYGFSRALARAPNWNVLSEGETFELVQHNALISANYDAGHIGYTDYTDTTRYVFTQIFQNASNQLRAALRLRNGATPNDTVLGATNLAVLTPYLMHWSGRNSGGTGSFKLTINGVNEALTAVTGANQWLSCMPGGDLLTIGAFGAGDTVQGTSSSVHGEKIVTGLLSADQSLAVERALLAKYGLV